MNFAYRGHEMMIQKRSAHDRNEEAHNGQKYPDKIFSDERIDPLLAQVQSKDAESLLGESGLSAELNHHLAQQNAQGQTGNHRNGSSAKTVIPPAGDVPLEIPRARLSTFEPVRIAKYHSGACLVLMRM